MHVGGTSELAIPASYVLPSQVLKLIRSRAMIRRPSLLARKVTLDA